MKLLLPRATSLLARRCRPTQHRKPALHGSGGFNRPTPWAKAWVAFKAPLASHKVVYVRVCVIIPPVPDGSLLYLAEYVGAPAGATQVEEGHHKSVRLWFYSSTLPSLYGTCLPLNREKGSENADIYRAHAPAARWRRIRQSISGKALRMVPTALAARLRTTYAKFKDGHQL